MIEVISSWAKSLGVTIVLVSILEMILPNNKTKKYIRMVLGMFVIFNIISPFIKNKDTLSLASINIEDYYNERRSNVTEYNLDNGKLDQTSMDKRIEVLYQDELEKDIIEKVEEQGYEVGSCKVEADVLEESIGVSSYDNDTGITKIQLKITGKQKSKESNNNEEQEENIEDKIVTGIERIKKVDVSGDGVKKHQSENEETNNKVSRNDIQNIKKFLIEEYGVSEKCLEIN